MGLYSGGLVIRYLRLRFGGLLSGGLILGGRLLSEFDGISAIFSYTSVEKLKVTFASVET